MFWWYLGYTIGLWYFGCHACALVLSHRLTTIVNKTGNIHKHSDGLRRWALPNTLDNPSYVPENAEPQIPIEGIKITDVATELFQKLGESYKQDNNCHIMTSLLDKD
ncbi:hypothetical protein O181_047386 [Austropuccinia psidii MF-1]|uniref:Uncharacterized protein n=1 Tax=Austropuccinia psidii MF-1 TaxID=1389203 RepID=A0A9Q3HJG4_9BASI|nr:hypothetical protein [Austropuccinia psidii MF-1]